VEYKEVIFVKFCVNLWHIFLVKIYTGITVTSCLYSIILSVAYIFKSIKFYDEYCRVTRSQFYMQG